MLLVVLLLWSGLIKEFQCLGTTIGKSQIILSPPWTSSFDGIVHVSTSIPNDPIPPGLEDLKGLVKDQQLLKLSPLQLSPLQLSPLQLSLDSPSDLSNLEALKFFQWKKDLFCVSIRNGSSIVFSIVVSDRQIYFDAVLKLPSTSAYIDDVDLLQVVVAGKHLWIFEACLHSNILVVTKVRLGSGWNEPAIHQIIPLKNHLNGFIPFLAGKNLYLVVAIKEGSAIDRENYYSELYQLKNNLFELSLNSTDCASYSKLTRIDSMEFEQLVYLTYVDQVGGGRICQFDPLNTVLQKVHELEPDISSVIPLVSHAGVTDLLLLLLKTDGSNDIWLLKENSFVLRGDEFENGFLGNYGISKSIKKMNYLILAQNDVVFVYQQPELNSTKSFSFKSSCGTVHLLEAETDGSGMVVAILCSSENGPFEVKYIYFDGKTIEGDVAATDFQSDSPYVPNIEKCLDELDLILRRNRPFIRDLKSILDDRLLLTADSDNVIDQPAHFNLIQTEELEAQNIFLQPPEELKNLNSRLDDLSARLMLFNSKMKSIEGQLPTLLRHSKDQHISAAVKMNKLTANSSNIFGIDVQKLNDIPIEDYKNNFLKLEDDQEITTNIVLDKVITRNLQAELLSNNIIKVNPDDLLDTRNSNQIISGQHTFSSLEVINNIDRTSSSSPLIINGIGTDEFVTSSANEVTFSGTKVLTNPLHVVHSIKMSSLNDVEYDLWHNSLLRMDSDSKVTVPGSLVVQGNVEIKGNLKVLSVSGIDIHDFSTKVVKKSEKHQIIEGPVEFANHLSVSKLHVNQINNVNWRDYLRADDSIVKAKFTIDEAVVIGNLNSDSVNGIDFDKDIVLTETDQVIDGQISFGGSVDVTGPEGVTMSLGATINGIDPSLHQPFETGLNHLVVNKELHFAHLVQLKGNVQISYLNGQPFPDLANNFWRKSISQKIPNDVAIESAHFGKNLYAQTLNGLKLDDYLQTGVDQTLTGRNYFTDSVEVLNQIDLKGGKLFDGVRLPELRDKAVRLDGMQSIHGPVNFNGGLVVKNLVIKDGSLKDVKIDDFINDDFHMALDKATFTNWILTDSLTVLGSIHVQTINEKRASSVLQPKFTPLSEIDGNLYLDTLEVKDLTVGGLFCGLDFNQWIRRTISKDAFSSQTFLKNVSVNGRLIFDGPVELERVNEKNFEEFIKQLAQTCDGCIISGSKRFVEPLAIFGNLTADSINGVNLEVLRNRMLSRSKSQTISGKYTFGGDVTADEVTVPKISEFPVDDLALINQPTKLKGTSVFASGVSFRDVVAPHNWLDGCNIDAVFNSPHLETQDIISSDVFLGHLKVKGNVSIDGNVFAGLGNVNVFSFLDRVVRRSQDQDITAETTFDGVTFIRTLETQFVNQTSVQEIIENITKKPENLTLNCDVKFLDQIIVYDLSVNNVKPLSSNFNVNGLNILDVLDSGVKRGSSGVVYGLKSISYLNVERNLSASHMNKIPLDELIKIHDKHYGNLKFENYLSIGGDLNIKGLVAGMEPSELFRHFESPTDEAHPSIFPPKYNLVEIKGDLIVNSINDLPLSDLVISHGKSQMITGHKMFLGGLTADGKVNIEVVNNIDLHQFNEWSQLQFNNISDDSMEHPFRFSKQYETNSLMKRTYLEKTAFKLRMLNDFNFQRAKTLHQELLSIEVISSIPIPGVIRLLPYHPDFPGKVSALVGSEKGCSGNGVVTYDFMIEEDQLQKIEEFYGLRIFIDIPDVKDLLYDFITPCSRDKVSDTIIRKLDFKSKQIDLKPFDFGVIRKIKHFKVDSRVYFVILSTTVGDMDGVKYRVSVVKAESDLRIVWKKAILIKAKDFDLHMINGEWTLVIGGEHLQYAYSTGYQSESYVYSWNDKHEAFMIVGQLEPATSIEFIDYQNDLLLILGQSKDAPIQRGGSNIEHSIKVYKKMQYGSTFVPYQSVPMERVSGTEAFVVSSDLYIAAFSNKEGSVRIFKMVSLEGFKEVLSFAIENPTSILYVVQGRKKFLVVASEVKIILLELHFGGVDGKLVKDPSTEKEFLALTKTS